MKKNPKKTQIFMNRPIYFGLSILEIVKLQCRSFGMIKWNQNIEKKQNYVTPNRHFN